MKNCVILDVRGDEEDIVGVGAPLRGGCDAKKHLFCYDACSVGSFSTDTVT